MFRRLYAWLFNKELVYVSFAYSHCLRIVRYGVGNDPYVMLYGEAYRLNKPLGFGHREVIWVRKKKE